MKCPHWKARLGAMDHSRGTSNKMIQEAMVAEITDLRTIERTLNKKIQIMLKGVERYEKRSERMIATLENKIRKLKGKS